ncbi:Qat anti-phage system QueC-like protein QatC [Petroclostridium sp. X23]|uniref:Qat anti-phage system QueC-like protein QatC n=1 Tax=Petroclostridium sp. X23 TaxID=3045146 RepID=UPI0024AE040B|nr:Qat anti-phage system QueC-like protein QatC [Petroclostridium sp. X23]WHH59787.1 hypothetical protein QKW49_03250 [Petroclostridium sp. X23]
MKIWINKTIVESPSNDFNGAIRFDMLDDSTKSNLKTNFDEIWGRFAKDKLESVCEDLLVIAASVYAADKRVPRSGTYSGETYDNWTRILEVSVPVIDIDKWLAVKDELEAILRFLSGDNWNFSFRKTEQHYREYLHQGNGSIIEKDFDGVALFSGGLDSFSGAIKLLEEDKNICFVGCREYYTLGNRIEELFELIQNEYVERNVDRIVFYTDPRHPRNIDESLKKKFREDTSRSRSFLFLAAALATASLIGEEVPVYIPENGFIGLNMPLTPSRLGSCSTRTTHIYFLNHYNKILQKLGIKHKVENFFALKTKGEIVEMVKESNAFIKGAGRTISCSHPMRGAKGVPGRPRNCGYCFPCLIRRASLNNIEVDDEYLDTFIKDYKISTAFIRNSKYANPENGRTKDLKAVLFALHEYLKNGSFDYYINKMINLGGLNLDDIQRFARVYMKSMEEIKVMIEKQADINGMNLLEYVKVGLRNG